MQDDHGKSQAVAQLESIKEMVADLRDARRHDDPGDHQPGRLDAAQQRILDDPLSVETRGGWHTLGHRSPDEEFKILLCTGGPAVRLIGELDQYMQPSSVRLEYQDWGTPWTEYPLSEEDEKAVLAYCCEFCYGD